MNPNTHARLVNSFSNLAFAIMFLVFLGGITRICSFANVFGFFICWFIFSLVLGIAVIYLVPVRCSSPDCKGHIDPIWENEAVCFGIIWRCFDECDTCGTVHGPIFSFSVGLGDP